MRSNWSRHSSLGCCIVQTTEKLAFRFKEVFQTRKIWQELVSRVAVLGHLLAELVEQRLLPLQLRPVFHRPADCRVAVEVVEASNCSSTVPLVSSWPLPMAKADIGCAAVLMADLRHLPPTRCPSSSRQNRVVWLSLPDAEWHCERCLSLLFSSFPLALPSLRCAQDLAGTVIAKGRGSCCINRHERTPRDPKSTYQPGCLHELV